MTWFKVDDGLHSHPKVLAAGNAAVGLWTRFGSYCSRYLTEGFVPESVAKSYGTRREIERLLDTGMMHRTDGGYQMHDFLDYNPSAEKVQQERADTAERVRQWRERRKQSNSVTNGDGNGVSNAAPTRPDPTRPTYHLHTQDDSLGVSAHAVVTELAAKWRA